MARVSTPTRARPTPSAIVLVASNCHRSISEDAVRYLCEARDLGGAIVARDTSLRTLRVL